MVIRFAGDSGDGMQLAGSRFTDVAAFFGNDLATFPSFPAEIRAPQGTLPGVSMFQVHIADKDIFTPGDFCDVLVANALEQPRVFVHRDYHSRNLMYTPENNPGILDFQDAVEGPLTYDLVSLLRDCYVRWPADQVYAWMRQFRAERAASLGRRHGWGVTRADALLELGTLLRQGGHFDDAVPKLCSWESQG